jgi:hypothetical protein
VAAIWQYCANLSDSIIDTRRRKDTNIGIRSARDLKYMASEGLRRMSGIRDVKKIEV